MQFRVRKQDTTMGRQRSDPASDSPGDQLAARALDAAGVGVSLLPVVANLYSVGLLLRRKFGGLPLTGGGARQASEAWRLNAIILGGAAVIAGVVAAVLVSG